MASPISQIIRELRHFTAYKIKKILLFKDELSGEFMEELVGLKPKMYSILAQSWIF